MPDHSENDPPTYHGRGGVVMVTMWGESKPASGARAAASRRRSTPAASTTASLFRSRTKSALQAMAREMPRAHPSANPRFCGGRSSSMRRKGNRAATERSSESALSIRNTVRGPENQSSESDWRHRIVGASGPQCRTTTATCEPGRDPPEPPTEGETPDAAALTPGPSRRSGDGPLTQTSSEAYGNAAAG